MNVLNKSVKEARGVSTKMSEVMAGEAAPPKTKNGGMKLSDIDSLMKSEPAAFAEDEGTSSASTSTMGYLQKKSGGKHEADKSRLRQNWRRRYFFLAPGQTMLTYHKDEQSAAKGESLGAVEVAGATLFLKQIKHGKHTDVFRFTITSAERELKLRATSEESYNQWVSALKPLAAVFRDLEEEAEDQLGDDDGELSDEEAAHSLSSGLRGMLTGKSGKIVDSGRDRGVSGMMGGMMGGGRDRGVSGQARRGSADGGGRTRGVTMAAGGSLEGWLGNRVFMILKIVTIHSGSTR